MKSETAPQLPAVKWSDTKPNPCACGCRVFLQGIELRVASALVSGSGQDEHVMKPTLYCAKCFTPFEAPQKSSLVKPA